MSKTHHIHKQAKKLPMMTPKEKRAAKRARKHQENTPVPFLPH